MTDSARVTLRVIISKGVVMETSVLFVRDFPVDLRKRAKMQALKEDVSLKAIIIKAVEEYLKKVGG